MQVVAKYEHETFIILQEKMKLMYYNNKIWWNCELEDHSKKILIQSYKLEAAWCNQIEKKHVKNQKSCSRWWCKEKEMKGRQCDGEMQHAMLFGYKRK